MMVHNLKNGTLLPLMEEFYTIQGEGYHAGRAIQIIDIIFGDFM
jgi:hypothetical protein